MRSAAVAALACVLACRGRDAAPPAAAAPLPDIPIDSTLPHWLADGARMQRVLTASATVDRGFRFTDARATSGITFVPHVVDDAAYAYKPVHYDHGTGVAAADVNGDGRPDLFFVSQRGASELWINDGGGKFHRGSLALTDAIAVAPAFADVDNDGDADLFVTTVRHGNHLFENDGKGNFRDVTATANVGYVGHSSGAVFFDYDRDGKLDLFVANVGRYTTEAKGPGGYYVAFHDAFKGHTHPDRAEPSVLYHNVGGMRFEDVTRATGLVDSSWSGDATMLDANDDGWPDLYVLDMQGKNHLWLNVPAPNGSGRRFEDATARYFDRTPWGAMGGKVFDMNGDGRLDLYVTDMHSDMFGDIAPGEWLSESRKSDPRLIGDGYLPNGTDGLLFGNGLYLRGAPRDSAPFVEASRTHGGETYWPWGPSVGDLNADGYDDVFVTAGMGFPFRYGVNALLMNDAGKALVHSEFVVGVEPRADVHDQPWYVVSCNGADRGHVSCTVCADPKTAGICRRDPKVAGRYTVLGAPSTRSSVILDVDGDGDLDIVTNEFGAPPQVLLSDLAVRRPVRWLAVRLRGTRSNREGLGARVTVVLPDGRRVVQAMDGNSGYLSRSVLPLYFGLGSADHAASIEVAWPSGRTQALGSTPSGRTIEVVEPD